MQATMRVSRDKDVPADTALAAKYLFFEKYGKSSFSIYIFHLYIYIFHLYIYILNKGKWHNQELVELGNTLWVPCSELLNSKRGPSLKVKALQEIIDKFTFWN